MKRKLQSYMHLSYNQAEKRLRYCDFKSYKAVWCWLAPRFGGIEGIKHDRFYEQHGKKAYYDRINKVRKAFGFKPMVME